MLDRARARTWQTHALMRPSHPLRSHLQTRYALPPPAARTLALPPPCPDTIDKITNNDLGALKEGALFCDLQERGSLLISRLEIMAQKDFASSPIVSSEHDV